MAPYSYTRRDVLTETVHAWTQCRRPTGNPTEEKPRSGRRERGQKGQSRLGLLRLSSPTHVRAPITATPRAPRRLHLPAHVRPAGSSQYTLPVSLRRRRGPSALRHRLLDTSHVAGNQSRAGGRQAGTRERRSGDPSGRGHGTARTGPATDRRRGRCQGRQRRNPIRPDEIIVATESRRAAAHSERRKCQRTCVRSMSLASSRMVGVTGEDESGAPPLVPRTHTRTDDGAA
jgi:hypothetical protein